MNTPPPELAAPPQPSDQILTENHQNLDESSSTPWEWANFLDFTFDDQQFDISWTPTEDQTVDTTTSTIPPLESLSEASNRGGSDGSDKIRKRDPRLTCENFLAGRVPCSCPELDALNEEEGEVGKKRPRTTTTAAAKARCQVPGCQVDISELKGYHKRHRVCLRCANASEVVLDGQSKRYCQQCGKFHILPDFDEGKRSCRRKLERHNKRRRRKPSDFRGAVENVTQVDQLAEDTAFDDIAGKDETPLESEDGNVSPLSSHPGSLSTQSESVRSFVTFGETQVEVGKDNSKYALSSSFGDNKSAHSTLCPTGRISFKLYDWNPAEFPRRLRHQIFQWLASMPVELEGYIRPGCTILTVFIAMPQFMWEKLSEDPVSYIHKFVNAPESMLFGRGSMTVYLNDMIFRVLKGGTSLMNVKMEVQAPKLHYVHPTCFEAGKPMEFVACGSNLLQPKFRFLVSFAGRYLTYDYCLAIPYGRTGLQYGTKEDRDKCCEHQIYKIYIPNTDPTLFGPAFVEVENVSGLSNFIPVLLGDEHICSEMKMVQQRLDVGLRSQGTQNATLDAISESCKGYVSRQATMSELLLDIGWLLKEPKLKDIQILLTFTQIRRYNCLLSFLIRNDSTIILEKILRSLKIVMDANLYNLDNENNDADTRLFQKYVKHARKIVHQRLQHGGELPFHSGNSVEKEDCLSVCYGENDMLCAVPSTSQVMEMAQEKLGSGTTTFQQSGEAVPLINKELVMTLTYGPHPMKVWPQKTCGQILSTTVVRFRPLFLIVTAAAVCFGICAVVLHPNKVGEFAVSIRRCLLGSSNS